MASTIVTVQGSRTDYRPFQGLRSVDQIVNLLRATEPGIGSMEYDVSEDVEAGVRQIKFFQKSGEKGSI